MNLDEMRAEFESFLAAPLEGHDDDHSAAYENPMTQYAWLAYSAAHAAAERRYGRVVDKLTSLAWRQDAVISALQCGASYALRDAAEMRKETHEALAGLKGEK